MAPPSSTQLAWAHTLEAPSTDAEEVVPRPSARDARSASHNNDNLVFSATHLAVRSMDEHGFCSIWPAILLLVWVCLESRIGASSKQTHRGF